ncbi:MAG: shikimate kinase [Thermodesulfobacteria bacterium]|nr:shikimate kinase [Thermodesulfobacteriota bacterium]
MKNKPGKILLIGYRATGKTAVGRELSRMLGCPFRDLDQLIEKEAGKGISDIVEEEGWDGFRKRERQLFKEMADNPKKFVLACGGGAVLHEDVMEQFRKKAAIVWLKAPIETMLKRMRSDKNTPRTRPSLTKMDAKEEMIQVYKERKPLYEKYAHIVVDTTDKSPFQIAQEISEALKYGW